MEPSWPVQPPGGLLLPPVCFREPVVEVNFDFELCRCGSLELLLVGVELIDGARSSTLLLLLDFTGVLATLLLCGLPTPWSGFS